MGDAAGVAEGRIVAGGEGDAGARCGIEAPVIDWRITQIVRRIVRANVAVDDKLVKETLMDLTFNVKRYTL